MGFDKILQQTVLKLANKEAYLQNAELLVVETYQPHCNSAFPCFFAPPILHATITFSIEKFSIY